MGVTLATCLSIVAAFVVLGLLSQAVAVLRSRLEAWTKLIASGLLLTLSAFIIVMLGFAWRICQ